MSFQQTAFPTPFSRSASCIVYPDELVDHATAINAAIAKVIAAGGGAVDLGARGWAISSQINLDPTLVSLKGEGALLDSSAGGTLGGNSILLNVTPSASALARGHAAHTISGLRFKGTGSAGSQKAVVFDGNGSSTSSARGNMRNCDIQDFWCGVRILDNAYVNKFDVVDIRGCAYGARTESGDTNRGERLSWVNCTLGNGNIIWAAGHSIDWMFTGCSFDFPGGAFIYTDDKVYCVNCHFEDGASTNKNWFQVDNNGHIYLTQCNVGFASGIYSGCTMFKQWGQGGKFRLNSCNGNVPASGVTVTNAGTDFVSDTGSSSAPFWS